MTVVETDPRTGARALWQPVPGTGTQVPLPQLVFIAKDGRDDPVRVPDWLRTREDMDRLISERGLTDQLSEVYWYGEDCLRPWFRKVTAGLGELEFADDPQEIPLSGTAVLQFTELYYQAAAKTLFHFFLAVTGEDGSDTAYDLTRHFIEFGKHPELYFRDRQEPFVRYPHPSLPPGRYSHLLAVENTGAEVRGYAQFFFGDRYQAMNFDLQISPDRLPVLTEGPVAYCYAYYKDPPIGRYWGTARPVDWRRILT